MYVTHNAVVLSTLFSAVQAAYHTPVLSPAGAQLQNVEYLCTSSPFAAPVTAMVLQALVYVSLLMWWLAGADHTAVFSTQSHPVLALAMLKALANSMHQHNTLVCVREACCKLCALNYVSVYTMPYASAVSKYPRGPEA